MTLTREFRDTIQARMGRDPAFREELLKEGVECLLSGDVDTGKAVLHDYINATIGFQEAERVNREVAQEPDAHVRPQRQSRGPKPVRDHRPPSGTRRVAPQSPGDSSRHCDMQPVRRRNGRSGRGSLPAGAAQSPAWASVRQAEQERPESMFESMHRSRHAPSRDELTLSELALLDQAGVDVEEQMHAAGASQVTS